MESLFPYLGHILNFNINTDVKAKIIRDVLSAQGYKYLGSGSSRITFLMPDERYVIKFPRYEFGIEVNRDEHRIWHEYKNKPHPKNGVVFAPCRLVYGSVLIMRAVSVLYGNAYADDDGRKVIEGYCDLPVDAPEWTSLIDCHQVGKLSDGRWVAYDYGNWFGNI